MRKCWKCEQEYQDRSYGWLLRHMLHKHGYRLTKHGGLYDPKDKS